ncbi:MAG: NAD(+) diphosphatase [Armatimonadetes bacterium]|nr:NAD(+) diphosphatase [Armatimonadota bacterium]
MPETGKPARFLPFAQGRDLAIGDGTLLSGAVGDALLFADATTEALYLGDLNGAACLAYVADETAVAESDTSATGLRNLFDVLPPDEYAVAGLAAHLLHWQTISRFCPKCGGATQPTANAWAKTCTVCGYAPYPVVSPAVLMLIHDGGSRVLLSHKAGWGDRWSILAGFVEPGETMEECVERETREEVGLSVTEIVYRGSQPWAFPHQLMIGFTARATDPDAPLTIDETELDGAKWFDANALPNLPGKLSLSRQLLDEWLRKIAEK